MGFFDGLVRKLAGTDTLRVARAAERKVWQQQMGTGSGNAVMDALEKKDVDAATSAFRKWAQKKVGQG